MLVMGVLILLNAIIFHNLTRLTHTSKTLTWKGTQQQRHQETLVVHND